MSDKIKPIPQPESDRYWEGANEKKLLIQKFGDHIQFYPRAVSTKDGSSCLLYTSPSPRDATLSRMPSSA